MQYSTILFNSHVFQAFTQLEQGLDELLDMYLYHISELLSKIYHTSDMSGILAGLNHYTVVYSLNCRRLKDSVVGHWSAQGKTMEDCFRDICNICAEYKIYCRADYNTPETSTITEVKTNKRNQECVTDGRPHFQKQLHKPGK